MRIMSDTGVILEIDHPHLVIRLSEDLLSIDVKGSFKDKVEEALGNTPILKDVFSLFVPLHIRLSDMDSARIEGTDKVKIVLRHHRDLTLPLGADEARKLVDKLNELIPGAKARELEPAYRGALAKEGLTSARARHARVLSGEGDNWEIEEKERGRSNED